MENNKKDIIIGNITKEINKLDNNEFTFFFFVIDSKGQCNGSVAYVYETALALSEMGYNVKMLHGEKEFVGVQSWLGEKYSSLPHFNIETDGVAISPSDFLIIPEIYSNVMYKTFEKNIPCKRIALLSNFDYMIDLIQPGATWMDYNIHDCIVSTKSLEQRLKDVFPLINTHVVRPYVSDTFYNKTKAKKLMFNIVASDRMDVDRVVKEFFWKFPMYKWVGFRDVRNLPREDFAKALDESFATIWIDTHTDFGYSALEAMKSGNIVIGKLPENNPDWMFDGDDIKDNGIWFYKMSDIHDIIANVVQSFIHNSIPSDLYDMEKKTTEYYNKENFVSDVTDVYVNHFVANRIEELTNALNVIKNNEEN